MNAQESQNCCEKSSDCCTPRSCCRLTQRTKILFLSFGIFSLCAMILL